MSAESALSRTRHLLIDLDGTLLESRDLPLRLEFVARALAGLSRRGGSSAFNAHYWMRSLRALRAVREALEAPCLERTPANTNAARAGARFAQAMGLSEEQGGRLLRDEVTAIFPKLERHFYPVPGAKDFLGWAAPQFTLRLATNPVWPIEQVEMRVRWAGLEPSTFASITHSGRMHACKPSLDYYEELLEQEGLEAAECLLIGDDLRKDLPAARAGVPVFILTGQGARQPRPACEIRALELIGMRAPAWAGSYDQLRALLAAASERRAG